MSKLEEFLKLYCNEEEEQKPIKKMQIKYEFIHREQQGKLWKTIIYEDESEEKFIIDE